MMLYFTETGLVLFRVRNAESGDFSRMTGGPT